ncbi:MAG: T9SS type A sorting domain-containing protein [Candidatus Cloacimonetes bacterium]|nr:T9SS type A sorting domain-containing protein [Candidatus Cloacimonadota bacterium]
MRKFFSFLIFSLLTFSLYSIEVGGHLTENTTWSPVNNPYLVTENIRVESGITLTILPGCVIKISGATHTTWNEFNQNFWLYGGDSVAKMFWINGRIIAEGTEQDSIKFTRMQNDPDYCWGCIYSPEQAEMSIFKYCKFEHSAGIGIYVGRVAWQTLSFYNGMAVVQNCDFLNHRGGLSVGYTTKYAEILYNKFSYDSNLNSFILSSHIFDLSVSHNENGYKPALIAGNHFPNRGNISLSSINFVNNINSISDIGSNNVSYFYDNTIANNQGWGGIQGGNVGDSLYIKNNQFIGGGKGISMNYAYVEVIDNYFEDCRLTISHSSLSKIINNIFVNNPEPSSNPAISGNVDIITNNIINNCGVGLSGSGATQFSNNIIMNNNSICSGLTDTNIIENEIIICNDGIFLHTPSVYGNPIFRNCILDFELPEGCIDGGGNIWVDSLQVQELFEDIQNGNFHLIEGSLAIDAGFDTLGYYYPFDMDYNHRIWDGDNNGSAIIDIGPYEYGSPAFGGIEGYTYNTSTGDPVDYVLLKINNQPGEFTFSDSIGCYEYKLPVGIYDVYAERVFYEDVIEYQVEVFEGQITQIFIQMVETVSTVEDNIQPSIIDIQLSNYPNPFNPSTTISFKFSNEQNQQTKIEIYNIKGQKIKQYPIFNHQSSIIWDGTDDNNKPVSSGIYFYKLKSDNFEKTNKMILLK